jgi:hypothetical protein
MGTERFVNSIAAAPGYAAGVTPGADDRAEAADVARYDVKQ